jgi:hypothetical protein
MTGTGAKDGWKLLDRIEGNEEGLEEVAEMENRGLQEEENWHE